MCGIVGHLGPKNSLDIVLEGLKRLEYRGYDSAGVSFVDDKQSFNVYKKSGKLNNLVGILEDKNHVARTCIGHTRWATHGEVNDVNSHPHEDKGIAIVHNGIIENAEELRDFLIQEGHKFNSQTDSEVFLQLVLHYKGKFKDFKEVIVEAFKKVKGNSAFVILNSETSDIFAIKKGAPLVCGINKVGSDALVSSDPYALAGIAERLYFPEDGVLCELSAANQNLINFYDLKLEKTKKYDSRNQDFVHEVSEKGSFEHFMLKEIHEQPELMRSITRYYFEGEGRVELENVIKETPKRILISACGTAFYAGLLIRDYIEDICRIPVQVELASEFRYRGPILLEGDLGVFISQSGETADTLAAQTLCKESGLKTLSIINVEGSSLYRGCDHNLAIRAGAEIGVASTKAFTQMVLTGILFAESLKAKDLKTAEAKIGEKFNLLAGRISDLIASEQEIKTVAEAIYDKKGFLFTGRGLYYPVSLEGALKLKEIAYVHAEGYAAGELKHGPIALIDESMVNIAVLGPDHYDKSYANLREVQSRKGVIVAIGDVKNQRLKAEVDHYISLNFAGVEEYAPLYINVVNQLLSYYMAKFKGTDIDKPRNLAKSVTVE
ncbi:MAG: glutamine--fructose-6-phosphate transaminase (isomerizing) [Bacteriovoracaceae bacterium]